MDKITKYILGCFIGLFCNAALAVMMVPTLSVGTYTLESTTRVSRTEFIYTYRASLTNPDVAVRNAAATLTITAPGVTVVDSTLSFGDVPAKSTAISTDTFSLRYDRTYTFSAADLHWSISYDPTPIITPPAAPSLTLGFGIKQLQFAWASISGATSYRLMQNPDGVAGYAQVGADLPADATATVLDIAVFKHDWVNARYLLEACNSSGCTASNSINTLNGMLSTIGYVKASNTGVSDFFGFTVAVSDDGNTLAVGAPYEASNSTGINSTPNELAYGAGAAYVYTRSAGAWSQQAYVKASNTGGNDNFGYSVALSGDGNTLAVGAPYEASNSTGINSTPNELAAGAGAAYVYTRSTGTWSQQAYVKASNIPSIRNDTFFGVKIALSRDGDTLAVGASGENSSSTGINSSPSGFARFSGAAYVYTRSAGTWSQQAYVKASNTGSGDAFGISVALSGDGNTLVVGAANEASSTTGVNSTPNELSPQAGAAYVYTRSAGTWSQQAYVKASNTWGYDRFGFSVAVSGDGNTLAVGALNERSGATGISSNPDRVASGAGAVYVYTRVANTWSQQSYVKASNTGAGDGFGLSVNLSGDGNTLAVGAPYEASATTGIDSTPNDLAPFAGAVYLY